jgi:FkbH-like protein
MRRLFGRRPFTHRVEPVSAPSDTLTALPLGPSNGGQALLQSRRDAQFNDHRQRAPQTLQLTPTPAMKGLVIGSCLSEYLVAQIKTDGRHSVDHLLFNNAAQLPALSDEELKRYDFQFVQFPLRTPLNDSDLFRMRYADAEAFQRLFARSSMIIEQLMTAALGYNERVGLLTFVGNFVVPQQNPMGRMLPRYDLRNLAHYVEKLNERIDQIAQRYSNVHLIDIDQISANFGRRFHLDDGLCGIGHNGVQIEFEYDRDQDRIEPTGHIEDYYDLEVTPFLRAIWHEIEASYRTVRQIDQVKLIIVDLDNTLWRGLIGEPEGIGSLEGWPIGVAEALIFLKERGLLLAICSKNEEAQVEQAWPYTGRLELSDFVVRKINWRPKADNVDAILKETGLLPHSTVFIDDNPAERAAVKAAFPDIRVLGADPYYLRRALLWAPETQGVGISAESSARTELVAAKIERDQAATTMPREAFLESLQLEVTTTRIRSADDPTYPRAVELINKTNQFNTTGVRWSPAELSAHFADGGTAYAFEVTDRFAKHGLVAVALVSGATINQFVMSCRVLGLDVEVAMLAKLMGDIKAAGFESVDAVLVQTEHNFACRDVYRRGGFEGCAEVWRRSLTPSLAVPPYVRMK